MSKLYIVATPIGNLKDITLRALETLKEVDGIICEDSRHTGQLLHQFQIEKKLLVLNDFNEAKTFPLIIDKLKSGETLALVTDAGTPLVSDPGYKLVRECIREKIETESIPGASAIVTALTISGLPPDKFIFVGYPPKKPGDRKKLLTNLATMNRIIVATIIMFESPYRVVKTLTEVLEIFGEIDVVICRELTKIHEEIRREKISESIAHFEKVAPKGEFTILFHT